MSEMPPAGGGAMTGDEIRAEYARLCEQFRIRDEILDRTQKRHRMELDLVLDDLYRAGSAREQFEQAHPEVTS